MYTEIKRDLGYINEGHRKTQLLLENFECDLCDVTGPVVLIMPPHPFGHLNICGKCFSQMQELLGEADAST